MIAYHGHETGPFLRNNQLLRTFLGHRTTHQEPRRLGLFAKILVDPLVGGQGLDTELFESGPVVRPSYGVANWRCRRRQYGSCCSDPAPYHPVGSRSKWSGTLNSSINVYHNKNVKRASCDPMPSAGDTWRSEAFGASAPRESSWRVRLSRWMSSLSSYPFRCPPVILTRTLQQPCPPSRRS